jgi:hypothetical protein
MSFEKFKNLLSSCTACLKATRLPHKMVRKDEPNLRNKNDNHSIPTIAINFHQRENNRSKSGLERLNRDHPYMLSIPLFGRLERHAACLPFRSCPALLVAPTDEPGRITRIVLAS